MWMIYTQHQESKPTTTLMFSPLKSVLLSLNAYRVGIHQGLLRPGPLWHGGTQAAGEPTGYQPIGVDDDGPVWTLNVDR